MTLRIELPLATFFIPADYGLSITCDYLGMANACVSIRGHNTSVDIYLNQVYIQEQEEHRKKSCDLLAVIMGIITNAISEILETGNAKILTKDDFPKDNILHWKYFQNV